MNASKTFFFTSIKLKMVQDFVEYHWNNDTLDCPKCPDKQPRLDIQYAIGHWRRPDFSVCEHCFYIFNSSHTKYCNGCQRDEYFYYYVTKYEIGGVTYNGPVPLIDVTRGKSNVCKTPIECKYYNYECLCKSLTFSILIDGVLKKVYEDDLCIIEKKCSCNGQLPDMDGGYYSRRTHPQSYRDEKNGWKCKVTYKHIPESILDRSIPSSPENSES